MGEFNGFLDGKVDRLQFSDFEYLIEKCIKVGIQKRSSISGFTLATLNSEIKLF